MLGGTKFSKSPGRRRRRLSDRGGRGERGKRGELAAVTFQPRPTSAAAIQLLNSQARCRPSSLDPNTSLCQSRLRTLNPHDASQPAHRFGQLYWAIYACMQYQPHHGQDRLPSIQREYSSDPEHLLPASNRAISPGVDKPRRYFHNVQNHFTRLIF